MDTAMILRFFILFVPLQILAQAGFADPGTSFEIPLRPKDKLMLRADGAQILWVVKPSAVLKVRGLRSDQGVRRGDLLLIDIKSENLQAPSALGSSNPGPQIEFEGPSLPAEFHWIKGSFKTADYKADLNMNLLEGGIQIKGSEGAVRIHLHQGRIEGERMKGPLTVSGYKLSAQLVDIGDVSLEVFQGQLNLQKVVGSVDLNQNQGLSRWSEVRGSVNLRSEKSQIQMEKFQGRLDAKLDEGSFSLGVLDDSEVQLRAQNSRVSVSLPQGLGAKVLLWTTELGEILLPAPAKVARGSNEKGFRGRLKGEAGKISLTLRNQEGTIQIN